MANLENITNYKIISKTIAFNLFIISLALISCDAIALFYHETIIPFAISSFIALFLGLLLLWTSKGLHKKTEIHRKDAYLTVTLSWLIMGLVGALPYLISHSIPQFTNAFFESVSGFTTTGSSILTNIEALPKSLLFWRSLTHWIGGIGIIILVIIILPSMKVSGYQLFALESSLQEKIRPRIRQMGYRLLIIYLFLTVVETILLRLGHMSLFDSVCHAFGTIATGGFSPKNTSICSYSPYIQYVIMIFMFLSGTSFVIHYSLANRQFYKIKQDEEFHFYLRMTFGLGAILTAALFFNMHKPLEEAFREAFFQIISIITCTGFASADYLLWPSFAWMIIFFAMFLGGSTGSTAGGIKMVRHLILFKNINVFLQKLMHPQAILPVKLNNKTLSANTNNSVLNFIVTYLVVFAIGSLILMVIGLDGQTASSSVATCMAGIGPGIGTVGPANSFAHLPSIAKLILTVLMILGRLEIFTVTVLFTRKFWEK